MMRTATIGLICASAACAAPRAFEPGALVLANPAQREQIGEIIARVEPAIITALGTRWPRKYRVEVAPDLTRCPADTRPWDRRVRLGPVALATPEQLELMLTHEIVHVHMTEEWTDLPSVVQEGVANWVAVVVIGRERPIWDAEPPTPEMIKRVMTLAYDEYQDLAADERYLVDYAAMYVASQIVRFGPDSQQGFFLFREP